MEAIRGHNLLEMWEIWMYSSDLSNPIYLYEAKWKSIAGMKHANLIGHSSETPPQATYSGLD